MTKPIFFAMKTRKLMKKQKLIAMDKEEYFMNPEKKANTST